MSVLVAYKRGDTIYMGTDTRVSLREVIRQDLGECNHKIQKMEGGLLVGVSAKPEHRQAILSQSNLFTLAKNGCLTRKHILTVIIPKLISLLDERGFLDNEKGERPRFAGNILLAHKDTLYEISPSFMVVRYEDYQICGEKNHRGQYVLYTIKEGEDVNEKIVKALDLLAGNTQRIGAPYLLIDTKELNYKIVGGNV